MAIPVFCQHINLVFCRIYKRESFVFGDSIEFAFLTGKWLCCAKAFVKNLTGDSVQSLLGQTGLKSLHEARGSAALQSFLNSVLSELLFRILIQK